MNWDERMHAKYSWWYAFELLVVILIIIALIWLVVRR